MDLGRQIIGQEVKGTVDILKISVIHLRYLRYFIDISLIFTDILLKIPAHARMKYTFYISVKYRHIMIFRQNIGDFPDVMSIFRPIDYCFAISYRYQQISDISVDVNDFLFLTYKLIFI